MKVALVHQPWNDPTPPVQSGSIAIWIDRVAPLLARHCEVIIYGRSPANRWDELRHAGVTYRFVPVRFDRRVARWLRRLSRRGGNRPYFSSPRFFATYTRNIAKDLARRGCDLVHLSNFSQMVPVVRRRNPHARILLHMQCEWLAQLDRAMVGPRIALADDIIGCSDFITRSTEAAFPDAAARRHTVYNGVDTEVFTSGDRTPHQAPQLIYVGRLSPEKGVHVLLRAFGDVLRRHPGARLEIVGPPALAPREFMVFAGGDPQLANLFDRYGESYPADLRALVAPEHNSRVLFREFVPHGDLPALIRNADVAVFPSIWHDPFPLTVGEAMATETAVVASRVGGIPEIVGHDESGLLVPPDDPEALSGALLSLIDDPQRRQRLARAGRERVVRRFSWQRIAADVLEVYGVNAGS